MEKKLTILRFALGMEKEGRDFFAKAAETTANVSAKQVFKDLVRMEEGHIAFIQANIDSLIKEGKWTLEPVEGLDKALGGKVFDARGKGKGPEPELAISALTGDMSALRIALAIENDLHEFYGRAAANSKEEDAKAVFTKLSGWEKEHREMLEAQYEEMKDSFWADMGFSPF